MRKLITPLALLTLAALTLASLHQMGLHQSRLQEEQWLPFAESMKKNELKHSVRSLSKRFSKKSKWRFVRMLYERHILHAAPSKEARIPKIIHLLALHAPLHPALKEQWQELHPTWECTIWTQEKYKEEFHTPIEEDESAQLAILVRFGGVVVKGSALPNRPLTPLHHLVDFYAPLLPLSNETGSPRLSAHLMAASPAHPIAKACLATVKAGKPLNLTHAFLRASKSPTHKNVALPASYLTPPAP